MLIVIEGPDGAGKTTLLNPLVAALCDFPVSVKSHDEGSIETSPVGPQRSSLNG